jgi:uncharacterized membrane protein YraQ (UPF0718 family)
MNTTGVMPSTRRLVITLAGAALLWAAIYALNEVLWTWLFTGPLGLSLDSHAAGSVHFFLYDSAKILLLLVGMIFVIGLVRTTIRPERVRAYLEGKPLMLALVLAAIFGAITPFCSCSSIPLFIGFVAAGIPLSVTLTFLIASPLVNEVAVVLLAQSFGLGNTVAYVLSGLTAAVLIGAVLSRFKLDHLVAAFASRTPVARLTLDGHRPTLQERVTAAREETSDILRRVWKWVLIGVAIGAVIHGWVPADFFATYAGADNPFAVVVATLAGIPLYSNAAGVVPVAEALWTKGVALGTVMSFMMATVALSLPEFILLKQVLHTRLLAIYFGSVAAAIMLIGLGFNLLT